MTEASASRVVSNTSPIINLAFIGLLNLLPQLYGSILIPDSVWHEVVVQGSGQPGAAELQQASWIKVETPRNRDLVNTLQLVPAIKPHLDILREQAGFRIGEALYARVLGDADES
jgi:predicted nucleic acid-binding protein